MYRRLLASTMVVFGCAAEPAERIVLDGAIFPVLDAAAPDAVGAEDATSGTVDAGVPDASVLDAEAPDAEALDAGEPDLGEPDATAEDATAEDATAEDATAEDASPTSADATIVADAGSVDDAGVTPDADLADALAADAESPEVGPFDGGATPCEVAISIAQACAPNNVPPFPPDCTGSTATQAACFIAYPDQACALLQNPFPGPSNDFFQCLISGGPDAGDAGPPDVDPFDTGPLDVDPFDTGPLDVDPFDTGPLDVDPFDTGPTDVDPGDTDASDGPLDADVDTGVTVCDVANSSLNACGLGTFGTGPDGCVGPQYTLSVCINQFESSLVCGWLAQVLNNAADPMHPINVCYLQSFQDAGPAD